MNPDRVFVVRSAPNLSRVRSLPPDLAWKRGRKFLVGYVGVVGRQERIDLLLESIKHIRRTRNCDDVQFVIVGSRRELEEVKKLAMAFELDELVTFTGGVDDATLFTILSTADAPRKSRPPQLDERQINDAQDHGISNSQSHTTRLPRSQ